MRKLLILAFFLPLMAWGMSHDNYSSVLRTEKAEVFIATNSPWKEPANWIKVVAFCSNPDVESTTPCAHSLGRLYYEGLGVKVGIPSNTELGVKYHLRAAIQGEFNSFISLGEILQRGNTSLGKDQITACDFYARAAALGHPRSWGPTVVCYLSGNGREVSFDLALLSAIKSKSETLFLEVAGQENLRLVIAQKFKILSEVFSPCPDSGLRHKCFGSLKSSSGSHYTGQWMFGKPAGLGIAYSDNGIYVGQWRDNQRDGQGTFIFSNGVRYVGGYRDNKRAGEGVEYARDGTVKSSGIWEDGKLVSLITLDTSRHPFNAPLPATANPLSEAQITHATIVRDRLNQERESMLAEAKERERQQAQAQQPQRPQAVLRNERRLALIIGNSSYKISPLDNPANDASDIAESLKKFGFQTTLVRNATLGQMREATRKFADQLPSADVALIYFAGHGIEANRKNYMIPVNADLKFEYELADQGYDAGIWLEMLESIKSNNADRVNIVILDACRNNSLIGSRNLGRGLGKMDAPSGTFLAYSTAPGKVAADGGRGERNSPFTKHLLRAMQQPNQPIEEVFKDVRRNVGKETNGAQVPWESTSLTGFFTFRQSR